MNNKILLFICMTLTVWSSFGQTKMGDNPLQIGPGSVLELESTTRGFVLPRMTTAQMNAINTGAVAAGMLVYNLDAKCVFQLTATSTWMSLCSLSPDSLRNMINNFITLGNQITGKDLTTGSLISITSGTGVGALLKDATVAVDTTALKAFIQNTTTASNGLTKVGQDIRLGGALTGATSIVTTGTNTLAISGLLGGSKTDSVVVVDPATGILKMRNINDVLTSSTTNTLVSTGNKIVSTVNGIADSTLLINSNSLTVTGNTFTSTVNGVASSATITIMDSTTASNGLNKVGHDVRLGGALTGATTITTTGANTLAVAGLLSGTKADSVVVADATTGVLRRRNINDVLASSTTNTLVSAGNKIVSTVNGVADSTNLINSNSLTVTGNTFTSTVNGVASSATITIMDSTTASNGLNKVGYDVRLGGALTGATTITTTGANTLAVAGLLSGTKADSVVVADATTGVLRRRNINDVLASSTTNTLVSTGNKIVSTVNGVADSTNLINSNSLTVTGNTFTSTVNGVASSATITIMDSTTASNGLNKVGYDVRLGGALTGATTITTTGANTLAVAGLLSGTKADSVVVADATTGVLRRRNINDVLASSTTNTLVSTGNKIVSTVNGVADSTNLINSNSLTVTGNTFTSTVNGVASSATITIMDSTTASNGLNKVGYDVRLGGALTGATTITTTGANTLAVAGLLSGTKADSVVVADATTGVLRRRNINDVLASSTTNTLVSTGNKIVSTVNGVADSTNLINSNSLTVTGNTFTSTVNGVASSATITIMDSTTASNGLNKVGYDVRLGGALTGATTITTTGANTLAVAGLLSGTKADSVVVADATTGVLRRRNINDVLSSSTTNTLVSTGNKIVSTVNGVADSTNLINSNSLTVTGNTFTSTVNGVASSATITIMDSTTASNGLNKVGYDVRLGGALTGATTITTTGANTLAVAGLLSGTKADSVVVADATTGVLRRRNINDVLSSSTTNTLVSTGNKIVSTVNGVADSTNLINSNSLTVTGNTFTSTVNGVASSATITIMDSTTASNGLNKVGYDVRLGGALTGATTITTTGANTLAVAGLLSGTKADSVVVADATTGVLRRRNINDVLSSSTTNTLVSTGNKIVSTVNGVADSTNLINSNSLTVTGNTFTSTVNGVASSATITIMDSTTASNGLNKVGYDVRLGGALTGATTITTTGANTLAVAGLLSGTKADSVVVADATTGVLRRRNINDVLSSSTTNTLVSTGNKIVSTVNGVADSTNLINSNSLTVTGNTFTSTVNGVASSATITIMDSTTASNGLNKVGYDVRLGGALTGATTITTTGANTLAVAGLLSGTKADSVVVADATTGVLRRRNINDVLSSSTTNTLVSTGNKIVSTVNGVADSTNLINSNSLTVTGNTFTSTVNGVASSATITIMDSTTASNGLNKVGHDVRLGGALTGATTITTTGANTLAVTGLQSGSANDSLVTVDPTTGIMKRISPVALAATNEPWFDQATGVGATSNTQNIYQMGNVGIGTTAPNSKLQVNGSVAFPHRKVSASTTVTAADFTVLMNCTAGSLNMTLPAANTCSGRVYVVGKTDQSANSITFSQPLFFDESSPSLTVMNTRATLTIQSDGTTWIIIARH